jgi:nicotinamidase-related amidase
MHGEATDQLYDRAGFGRSVIRGSRPAVVVVDLARGFTEPEHPTGADLSDEVRATARLIEGAHDRERPVYLTTVAFQPGLRDAGTWLQKAPGLGALLVGSALVELDPRLGLGPLDTVIVKKGASAFFGTNLAALLVADRVDTVILAGATTSGCVRATAVDSMQHGFATLVPRECVGDRAAGPHEANLFDMHAKYADVTSLDDVLAYLAQHDADPDDPRRTP